MLILAGVTINGVINGGLLDSAQNAKSKWEQAQTDEQGALKDYEDIIDNILGVEKYEIAITSPEQIYALGRLLNSNTRIVAGLTSYSNSELEATDLSLFEFPEEYKTNTDKITFLQTTSYGLENDITLTLQRGTGTDCFLGIGGSANPFKGSFNGKGKTITILGNTININANFSNGMGLFGQTENAKISNLNINLGSNITINSISKNDFRVGLLVGYANLTEINNVSIKMEDNGINVDFNTSYRNAIDIAPMIGYIKDSHISNCQVNMINSSIMISNDNEDNSYKYNIGGLVGKTENVNTISSCNVEFIDGKIGFDVENTGELTGYGSAVGGIIGFANAGSDNTNNIGRNGTTITNCNFTSSNSSKQEVIYAKENIGASPNAGGIVGLSFNNCSIINSNVNITNGIIISQRLLENATEASFGATCGGIIGRLEHTGRISGCTVQGNNLDIIAASTEREMYSGGIVGCDIGPYHKNQISLEDNEVIGNNNTTVQVKVISENGMTNRYIGAGGIAGSSTYIVKDCVVNGTTIINEGSNSNSRVSAIGKIVGVYTTAKKDALWTRETYFEPNENIGILNCSSTNVTLSTDNNIVSTGEVYGIEY